MHVPRHGGGPAPWGDGCDTSCMVTDLPTYRNWLCHIHVHTSTHYHTHTNAGAGGGPYGVPGRLSIKPHRTLHTLTLTHTHTHTHTTHTHTRTQVLVVDRMGYLAIFSIKLGRLIATKRLNTVPIVKILAFEGRCVAHELCACMYGMQHVCMHSAQM